MDSLFVVVKIIHITTMLFYVAAVGYKTFIFSALSKTMGAEAYKSAEQVVGGRTRSIIKVNNVFLILSGLFLFSQYQDSINILLIIKAMMGLTIASLFYFVPYIIAKFNHINGFGIYLHHGIFFAMLTTIVLSQVVFL